MKKIKVVVLADPIDEQKAGVHVYLKSILSELRQRLPLKEFTFIFIHSQKSEFWNGLKTYRIPEVNWLPGWTTFRKFLLIPLIINFLKVDIVWEPAHFGPFCLGRRVKRITTIHDLTPILFPAHHKFAAVCLHRIFLKRILKKASAILVNSQNTKRDLIKYSPQAKCKVYVIPLAVGPSVPADAKQIANFEQKFPHLLKNQYFLFVSTIEPRKDIPTLLTAFAQFKAKTPSNHKLVLVGALGWHTEAILSDIKKSPYFSEILVLGHVPDILRDQLYRHACAFIYPSVYEGFGLPILEAMSHGAPCLVAKNSSLTEVGGSAALYFQTGSSGQLFNLMAKVTGNPQVAHKLSDLGRKQAARFSWSRHVDHLLEEFNALAK